MKQLTIFLPVMLMAMNSCLTASYSPMISLDKSDKIIHKKARIDKFVDMTPFKDRRNPYCGTSVASKNTLVSNLDLEITNAIAQDFQSNAVFETANRYEENPDYIISGEIKRYFGKHKLTNYGLISSLSIYPIYTWYFGIPIRKNEVIIQINLIVKDGKGNLIKTYSGNYEHKSRTSIYNKTLLALPSETNKGLSDVIRQIREQLLTDLG